jgi:hypothetical protein
MTFACDTSSKKIFSANIAAAPAVYSVEKSKSKEIRPELTACKNEGYEQGH